MFAPRFVSVAAVVTLALAAHALGGCQPSGREEAAAPSNTKSATATSAAGTVRPGEGGAPEFSDVASEVGIDFVHNTGAFGQKWLPETMGSGCAWLDYDGDGDQDALLLSGRDFAGHATGGRQTPALYRNDDGRFTDVSAAAGVNVSLYAMGATVGDFDEDGDPDVYVTALGPNHLWRNDGGKFVNVAKQLGVDDPGFGSSATWVDYDGDADLDLVVLNYVKWSPETDIFCTLDGTNKAYCTPEAYNGDTPHLFRNDGGRFTDVTEAAGLYDPSGKGLGVIAFDYDGDHRPDIFVANDTQPNALYHNEGDGTFSEQAVLAGVAFDEAGRARGAMGVDVADYDGTGLPSLAIGNFSNEMIALYHNEGAGFFIDSAPTSALGRQSLLTLAFGTIFLDYDLDGLIDLFVTNGHVESEIAQVQSQVSYAQPMHLFRNVGGGRFEDVAPKSETLSQPIVGRGCAAADYDGDGDLDLLVVTSGGRAKLLRNDGADGARGLRVHVVGGDGSCRDAYGAEVAVTVNGTTRRGWVRAAQSYASQSEPTLTFGLGDATQVEAVEVRWPSGRVARKTGVSAGQMLTFRESEAAAL
ncbi:MAG: CRTAC1 family protein [Gemmatimonadetes bacterium]|nr:CRTAC1 family protein [Gemmatimonadota bacterium]